MDGYEVITGYQSQGGRHDLGRIVTFKKYRPVFYPKDSVGFSSCLVDIPYVHCARRYHLKPPPVEPVPIYDASHIPQ